MSNIENSFKESLTNFDQVSPSTGLWLRIKRSLFLKSAAFRVILWSLIALLLISIPSIFLLSENNGINNNSPEIAHNSINENSNIQNNTNNKNKQSISSPDVAGANTKTAQSTSKIVNSNKNNNNSSSPINNNQAIVKVPKNIIVKNEVEKTVDGNNKQQPNTTTTKQRATPENIAIVSSTLIAHNSINTRELKQYDSVQKNQKNATIAVNTRTNSTPVSSNTELTYIERMPLIIDFFYQDFDNQSIPYHTHNSLNSQRLVYANQLEIFAGPNIAFNNLTTDNHSFDNHIQLRTESESPKLSYHIGANYKTYYNKWFLSVGINYHRIEDRATYSLPTIDIDSVISNYMIFHNTYKQVITGYIQNPNDTSLLIPIIGIQVHQDTNIVSDVYYDTTKSINNYSYTNSYSYIEIPLMIGHEFRYKQFVFDIVGGVSWGRLIKSEVSIPNTNNDLLMDIQQTETILVKNTFNGLLGLGIGYQINEGNVLFARPEIRYNLNSMLDKAYPINQKYMQIRLSLGMRIQL